MLGDSGRGITAVVKSCGGIPQAAVFEIRAVIVLRSFVEIGRASADKGDVEAFAGEAGYGASQGKDAGAVERKWLEGGEIVGACAQG